MPSEAITSEISPQPENSQTTQEKVPKVSAIERARRWLRAVLDRLEASANPKFDPKRRQFFERSGIATAAALAAPILGVQAHEGATGRGSRDPGEDIDPTLASQPPTAEAEISPDAEKKLLEKFIQKENETTYPGEFAFVEFLRELSTNMAENETLATEYRSDLLSRVDNWSMDYARHPREIYQPSLEALRQKMEAESDPNARRQLQLQFMVFEQFLKGLVGHFPKEGQFDSTRFSIQVKVQKVKDILQLTIDLSNQISFASREGYIDSPIEYPHVTVLVFSGSDKPSFSQYTFDRKRDDFDHIQSIAISKPEGNIPTAAVQAHGFTETNISMTADGLQAECILGYPTETEWYIYAGNHSQGIYTKSTTPRVTTRREIVPLPQTATTAGITEQNKILLRPEIQLFNPLALAQAWMQVSGSPATIQS